MRWSTVPVIDIHTITNMLDDCAIYFTVVQLYRFGPSQLSLSVHFRCSILCDVYGVVALVSMIEFLCEKARVRWAQSVIILGYLACERKFAGVVGE